MSCWAGTLAVTSVRPARELIRSYARDRDLLHRGLLATFCWDEKFNWNRLILMSARRRRRRRRRVNEIGRLFRRTYWWRFWSICGGRATRVSAWCAEDGNLHALYRPSTRRGSLLSSSMSPMWAAATCGTTAPFTTRISRSPTS